MDTMDSKTIVRVVWLDSGYSSGWVRNGRKQKLCKITSVGYLLKKNKNRVVISPSINIKGGQHFGPISIPRSVVIKYEIRT